MLSPIYYNKAGVAYLSLKNYAKAIETFEMIRRNTSTHLKVRKQTIY